MTEEIKEILYLENYISKYKGDEKSIINGNRLTTPAMLDYLEVKSILNYITNIQKEKDNYKQRNEKAIESIKDCKKVNGDEHTCIIDHNYLLNILEGGDE